MRLPLTTILSVAVGLTSCRDAGSYVKRDAPPSSIVLYSPTGDLLTRIDNPKRIARVYSLIRGAKPSRHAKWPEDKKLGKVTLAFDDGTEQRIICLPGNLLRYVRPAPASQTSTVFCTGRSGLLETISKAVAGEVPLGGLRSGVRLSIRRMLVAAPESDEVAYVTAGIWLCVNKADGQTEEFLINESVLDSEIEVRVSQDEGRVWILSEESGKAIASVDFESGDFAGQSDPQPGWAVRGQDGDIVYSGRLFGK